MEKKDLELIEKIIPRDPELRELMEEHDRYEDVLAQFKQYPYLTETEETEQKRIKKLKLMGRDRIEEILSEYRQEGNM
jgi:uncharacterized protein YdcH (DUF465 family)